VGREMGKDALNNHLEVKAVIISIRSLTAER
jgi:hypothetical protein